MHIKALLIGIEYMHGKTWSKVAGARKDIEAAENAIRSLSTDAKIRVMGDWLLKSDLLYPSRVNLKRELDNFIDLEMDNVQYFIWYAGHSDQQAAKLDLVEEDEQDEYLVPADHERQVSILDTVEHRVILDNELSNCLVGRLKYAVTKNRLSKVSLLAIFDSCHSGTLLDLPHYRCNRIHNWQAYARQFARKVFELEPIQDAVSSPRLPAVAQLLRFASTNAIVYASHTVPEPILRKLQEFYKRISRRCSGFCARDQEDVPLLISISATRDPESVVYLKEYPTMTMSQIIAQQLKSNPNITLEELMHQLCKCSRKNFKLRNKGWRKYFNGPSKDPTVTRSKSSSVPSNPEISSLSPLFMDRKLFPFGL